MHFKTFPRTVDGHSYPVWEEIILSDKEELISEQQAKRENLKLMKRCLDDAKKLLEDMGFREYQSDILGIALTMFRKQASHVVYWKDSRCKEKFDRRYGNIVVKPCKAKEAK